MNTKPKEQKKTKLFSMWVTERELNELRKRASKQQISMSQYIRKIMYFDTFNNDI